MKTRAITAFFLFAILCLGIVFPDEILGASTAGTQTLFPISYTTLTGDAGGQAVGNLAVKDQSARADDPAKYVTFTTPGVTYDGYRTYLLPGSIPPGALTSLQVKVNYKGMPKSRQIWTWYFYDWAQSLWVKVGNNAIARNNVWTLLNFNVSSPSRFVSGSGEMRLALRSKNASGDAKLDYEAVIIKYTQTPTPTTTAAPTNTPGPTSEPGDGPTLAGCPVFPADNIWNARVDNLPIHPRSSDWINTIGRSKCFHMDFGSGEWDGGPIGIPYNILPGNSTAKFIVDFYYADESDPGPYPIPDNPLIEYGSDHHILILDSDNCYLYEIFDASYSNGQWSGGSGAIWDLRSNALRPAGWTSADAAGLPILPGLVRYDEIQAGEIRHAIRFTAHATNRYIWPARHLTSDTSDQSIPPMGARFRLKASFDISGYPPELQVILQAMKTYGLILADNGSDWFVSGAPDERWDNDMLHLLDTLTGNDFEAVDESGLMADPDSGQVVQLP